MTTPDTHKLEKSVHEARQALSDSHAILHELLEDKNSSDDSMLHEVHMLQLLLQYRLDTQDALANLLHIDNHILQILGIEPQHSSRINLERMAFALGSEDLHHLLHALSQLVQALSRIAHRYQQHLDKVSKQKLHGQKSTVTQPRFERRLQKAVELQKYFKLLMTDISHHLDQWNKLAPIGPVLDHIAALRGPISQFFQAMQNGLELTHQLYENTNKGGQLDHTLGNLLQQAESILKCMPSTNQPHPFFTPIKMDTDKRLEQRASNRRLGHFFRN